MHLNPTQNSFSQLSQLFGNELEALSVLQTLSSQIQNIIPLLRNAITVDDFKKAEKVLHQLRSELGICGYQELSEQTGQVEKLCRNRETTLPQSTSELLIEQFGKTISDIAELNVMQ